MVKGTVTRFMSKKVCQGPQIKKSTKEFGEKIHNLVNELETFTTLVFLENLVGETHVCESSEELI